MDTIIIIAIIILIMIVLMFMFCCFRKCVKIIGAGKTKQQIITKPTHYKSLYEYTYDELLNKFGNRDLIQNLNDDEKLLLVFHLLPPENGKLTSISPYMTDENIIASLGAHYVYPGIGETTAPFKTKIFVLLLWRSLSDNYKKQKLPVKFQEYINDMYEYIHDTDNTLKEPITPKFLNGYELQNVLNKIK